MTDTPPTPDTTPHTYAEITDGTVTNVLVANATYAAAHGWIGPLDGLNPQPGIGWACDATTNTWTAPPAPAPDPGPPAAVTAALATVQAAVDPSQTTPSQDELNQAFATLALAVAPTLGATPS